MAKVLLSRDSMLSGTMMTPHTRIPQRARTRRAQEIFEHPESLKAVLYSGREVIALQGLPVDELLLTRESQREVFGRAGNTVTFTVVGEALLSALTVSCKILTRQRSR